MKIQPMYVNTVNRANNNKNYMQPNMTGRILKSGEIPDIILGADYLFDFISRACNSARGKKIMVEFNTLTFEEPVVLKNPSFKTLKKILRSIVPGEITGVPNSMIVKTDGDVPYFISAILKRNKLKNKLQYIGVDQTTKKGNVSYHYDNVNVPGETIVDIFEGNRSFTTDLDGNVISKVEHLNDKLYKNLSVEHIYGADYPKAAYLSTDEFIHNAYFMPDGVKGVSKFSDGTNVYTNLNKNLDKLKFHSPEGKSYIAFLDKTGKLLYNLKKDINAKAYYELLDDNGNIIDLIYKEFVPTDFLKDSSKYVKEIINTSDNKIIKVFADENGSEFRRTLYDKNNKILSDLYIDKNKHKAYLVDRPFDQQDTVIYEFNGKDKKIHKTYVLTEYQKEYSFYNNDKYRKFMDIINSIAVR